MTETLLQPKDQSVEPSIVVTEKAARKAIELAQQQGCRPRLRVGVKGGGCSGLSYVYTFDDKVRDNDWQIESYGLTVVCDRKSLDYLAGCTFDYEQSLLQGAFRFINPQAKRSCSCGESFSV